MTVEMHRIVSAFTQRHQNAWEQNFQASDPTHHPEGDVLSDPFGLKGQHRRVLHRVVKRMGFRMGHA